MASQEPRALSYDPRAREWSLRLKSRDLSHCERISSKGLGGQQVKSLFLTNLHWLPIESRLNCSQSPLQCDPKPPPKYHLPLLTHHPLLHFWLISSMSPNSLPPSAMSCFLPEKPHHWMAQEQLSASTSRFDLTWIGMEWRAASGWLMG